MRGRVAVMLIVVGVLALVAVGAAIANRTPAGVSIGDAATSPEPVAEAADPAATLDAALANGQPVYVLIHSLT